MKLTWAEYERGIVSWETREGSFAFAIESLSSDGIVHRSAVLENAAGSLVSDLAGEQARFIVHLRSPDGDISKFRWEQADGTSIWDGPPTGDRLALQHIPDYGTYHRLVLNAANCDWGQDAVVLFDQVRVRFVTGSVDGERAAPMDQVEVGEAGQFSITGEASGSATATGRFVDICAPGEDESSALENAWGVAGLVAFILGPASLGGVVFSEGYSAEPKRFSGSLAIPITAQSPYVADGDAADVLEDVLPALGEDTRHGRALRLAVRWYAKALRASDDEDSLFSHFIGVETILNAFAADRGPVPAESRRRELIAKSQSQLKKLLGSELDAGRMAGASLFEKFKFYATEHDISGEWLHRFRALARTRNDAFHGDAANITAEQVRLARDLHVEILKLEFKIDRKFAWESVPRVGDFKIFYDYRPD